MRDQIEKLLREYRTQHMRGDDGEGMALVDLLSCGPTIQEGEEEIHLLADWIAGGLSPTEKHYFTPSEENDRFCAQCGNYLTDDAHFRA
jgi:hypothetical protein